MEEALEPLGMGELAHDLALPRGADLLVILLAFDTALNPQLFLGPADVHELVADGPAVGLPQHVDDLTERRGLQAQHVVDEDRPVQIAVGEAVRFRIELGMVFPGFEGEGIEIGQEMPADAIGADQHQGPHGVQGRLPAPGRRFPAVAPGVARDAALTFLVAVLEQVAASPGRAPGRRQHVRGVVAQAGEELPPSRSQRCRIVEERT